MRFAYIENGRKHLETIKRYMPSNYDVAYWPNTDVIIIHGEDVAGWTLDGYVIPRLASGNFYAKECE